MGADGQPSEAERRPGAVLDGRFRLLGQLGRGGFGEVWRASELLPDGSEVREVALKLMAPTHVSADWAREARVLASLRHQSLVTVFSAGILELSPPVPFVAMELLEGKTLAARAAERGPTPWRRALFFAREIAAALDRIHAQGIVHLDLKPSNLLLCDDGVLRVLDFGIARQKDGPAAAPPTTDAGDALGTGALLDLEGGGAGSTGTTARDEAPHVVGTPGFMAPEVVEGRDARPAADAYALGVCLHQLITGELPQRARRLPARADEAAIAAWRAEVRAATVAGELRDLGDAAKGTPPAVVALVRRLSALDPAARPAAGTLEATVDEVWARPYGVPIPPYRGLSAYGREAEGLLFGREADAERLARDLTERPVLVLQGASGSGKSSLAVAGVVPALARAFADGCDDWVAAEVRPGQDVNQAVRRAREAAGPHVGVVLVVDQLEELVTQLGAEARARFALALTRYATPAGDAARTSPGVRVLGTLREDFTTRVAALGALGALLEAGVRFVPPPSAASVRDIVVGPAALAGVTVDDEKPVVDDVLRELRAGEGRLPLLSFALAEWWQQREGRVLSAAAWKRIGGVAGALSRHADATLSAIPPDAREAARTLCLRLVSPEGTRARLDAATLRDDPATARVLEAFVAARLVTLDETACASFSHEALLSAWATLAGWIEEERADRAEAAALAVRSSMWRAAPSEGRAELLLSGAALARAEEWRRRRADLAAPFVELLDASRRRAARGRMVTSALVTAALAVAAVFVGAGWLINQRIDHELRVREENLKTLQETGNRNAKAVESANRVIAERNAELLSMRGDGKACKDAIQRLEQEHRTTLAGRYPADSFEQKLVSFLLAWEHAWNLHDDARVATFFAPDVDWFGVATPRDTLARNLAATWRKSPSNRLLLGEIAVVKRDGSDAATETTLRVTRDERTNGVSSLAVTEVVVRGDKPESFAIQRGALERTIASGKSLGCN